MKSKADRQAESRGAKHFHKKLTSMLSKLDALRAKRKSENRLIKDVQITLMEIESILNGGV